VPHTPGMADPVSWLLIRSGWTVVSADGQEIGRVDEVAGDESHDIFDGLAVATSMLGKPRYVPAEQVGRIEDGTVHLTLTRDQCDDLREYLEPATSVEIEPGGGAVKGELRGLESRFVDPPQSHEHPVNLWRRLWFALRRPFRR
jgi:hypothetical protein